MAASGRSAAGPALTVVTVTRGRADLLRRKAASLAGQEGAGGLEWRVGVNGPDPASEGVLEGLELPFPLAVLRWPEPLAAAAARNRVAEGARAPLLLMSDDDCTLEPGSVAARLAAHARAPWAAVVGPLRLPEALRDGRRREPFERVGGWFGRALWINATGANTSFPTEAFRRVGGYDATFRHYGGEDPDLALRLRGIGLGFRFEPRAACVHHGRVLGAGDAKPELAGRAHWRVFERHPTLEVGVLLGVHPWMLRLKRAWLEGPGAILVPPDARRYELAYLRGAEAARREARDAHGGRAGEERT